MKLSVRDVYFVSKKTFSKKDGSRTYYTVDYLFKDDSNNLVAVSEYIDNDTYNKIVPEVHIDGLGVLINNPIKCRGHFNFDKFLVDEFDVKE